MCIRDSQGLEAFHQGVAGINIDPGVAVAEGGCLPGIGVLLHLGLRAPDRRPIGFGRVGRNSGKLFADRLLYSPAKGFSLCSITRFHSDFHIASGTASVPLRGLFGTPHICRIE